MSHLNQTNGEIVVDECSSCRPPHPATLSLLNPNIEVTIQEHRDTMHTYPEAERASERYAYVDPETAHYAIGRLPEKYHPLDAWQTIGKQPITWGIYSCYPIYGSLLVLVAVGISQHAMYKRPAWSQTWKHLLGCIGGAAMGHSFYYYGMRSAARRDAVIRHYLELHYDDFPIVGQFL